MRFYTLLWDLTVIKNSKNLKGALRYLFLIFLVENLKIYPLHLDIHDSEFKLILTYVEKL